jgi:hypothetical protein
MYLFVAHEEHAAQERSDVSVGSTVWYWVLEQTVRLVHVLSVSRVALHAEEIYWVDSHAVHSRARVAQLRMSLVDESNSTKARSATFTEPVMGMLVSEYESKNDVMPVIRPCRSPRLPTEQRVPSSPIEHVPDTLYGLKNVVDEHDEVMP